MKMISKKKLLKKTCLLRCAPTRQNSSPYPDNNSLNRVYREIAILKKLDHPNVVKLIEVLDDPTQDYLCLVFELVEKGCVIDIPTDSPLSEEAAWKYFRDLILGIEFRKLYSIPYQFNPDSFVFFTDSLIWLIS